MSVKVLFSILVFLAGEGVAAIIFWQLAKRLDPARAGKPRKGAMAKGALERLTMLVGLLAGFPHILTAFGALKISTRLKDDQGDRISNNYFLTGNLVSLLLAMTYAWLIGTLPA